MQLEESIQLLHWRKKGRAMCSIKVLLFQEKSETFHIIIKE